MGTIEYLFSFLAIVSWDHWVKSVGEDVKHIKVIEFYFEMVAHDLYASEAVAVGSLHSLRQHL